MMFRIFAFASKEHPHENGHPQNCEEEKCCCGCLEIKYKNQENNIKVLQSLSLYL